MVPSSAANTSFDERHEFIRLSSSVIRKIGGIQMGVADLPASRMFIAGQYSGLPSPIISDCAQLEMHDTFPFSAGVRSINNLFSDTTTS